jgi:hypothetical protein
VAGGVGSRPAPAQHYGPPREINGDTAGRSRDVVSIGATPTISIDPFEPCRNNLMSLERMDVVAYQGGDGCFTEGHHTSLCAGLVARPPARPFSAVPVHTTPSPAYSLLKLSMATCARRSIAECARTYGAHPAHRPCMHLAIVWHMQYLTTGRCQHWPHNSITTPCTHTTEKTSLKDCCCCHPEAPGLRRRRVDGCDTC